MEEVVFICVSISIEIAIIIKPIEASNLLSINLEISPTTIKPTRQITALGNIVKPDMEGLYPNKL